MNDREKVVIGRLLYVDRVIFPKFASLSTFIKWGKHEAVATALERLLSSVNDYIENNNAQEPWVNLFSLEELSRATEEYLSKRKE